jgi:CheY-like chemotaxis protein
VNACLQHYDSLETPNTPTTQSTFKHAYHGGWASPLPSSDSTNEFSARLGMYHPPLVVRTKSDPSFEETISPVVQAQSPPKDIRNEEDSDKPLRTEHALVVDDNAINRRVLSAWMKKHSIPYNEVKDGQQALDLYKEANGQFDAVLMDISMPVMDGMTATRLIREFEKERGLTPTHIIALTGLTSASAKLEAWTSGVDDYLTKPVDFKRLEKLLEVGRGGEGTGFMKEHGSIP